MPTKERAYSDVALLSRSRFIADAAQPLRFYREYFKPDAERELEKDRRRSSERWLYEALPQQALVSDGRHRRTPF